MAPYDGAGNYALPPGGAVDGTTADAADVTVPFDDIEAALSQVLLRSGVAPMTGDLDMGGFAINNTGGSSGAYLTTADTGTSGHKIPYLDVANTWSAVQTVSAGIKFPATETPSADANTLDDYEDGTYTPTYTDTGGPGVAATTHSAGYVKIGGMVQFSHDFTITNTGAGVGNVVASPPFPAWSQRMGTGRETTRELMFTIQTSGTHVFYSNTLGKTNFVGLRFMGGGSYRVV